MVAVPYPNVGYKILHTTVIIYTSSTVLIHVPQTFPSFINPGFILSDSKIEKQTTATTTNKKKQSLFAETENLGFKTSKNPYQVITIVMRQPVVPEVLT